MKAPVYVAWMYRPERQHYAIRVKGARADAGEVKRTDTILRIPPEEFERRGVSATEQTSRGDAIAEMYAVQYQDVQCKLIAEQQRRRGAGPTRHDEATIAELWKLYEARVRRVKEATVTRNRKNCRPVIAFFDDVMHVNPSAINLSMAEQYVAWRSKQKAGRSKRTVSDRSIYNELSFLKFLIAFALDRGDETGIRTTALAKLPQLDTKGEKKRVVTPAEFLAMVRASYALPKSRGGHRQLRGDMLREILVVGYTTRLRRTPLLALDGSWLDRDEYTMNVPANAMKGSRELRIPVSAWPVDVIRHRPKSGPVWRSWTNDPLVSIERALDRLADAADVPHFSLHALRRGGNSFLLNHRCENHPSPPSTILTEMLLGHTLSRMDSAYYFAEESTLRHILSAYDELRATFEKDSGIVTIGQKAAATR